MGSRYLADNYLILALSWLTGIWHFQQSSKISVIFNKKVVYTERNHLVPSFSHWCCLCSLDMYLIFDPTIQKERGGRHPSWCVIPKANTTPGNALPSAGKSQLREGSEHTRGRSCLLQWPHKSVVTVINKASQRPRWVGSSEAHWWNWWMSLGTFLIIFQSDLGLTKQQNRETVSFCMRPALFSFIITDF